MHQFAMERAASLDHVRETIEWIHRFDVVRVEGVCRVVLPILYLARAFVKVVCGVVEVTMGSIV